MREREATHSAAAGESDSPVACASSHETEPEAKDSALIRAIRKFLRAAPHDPGDAFGAVCSRLKRRLKLQRATLFIATDQPHTLQSYALWDKGLTSSGVLISVPREDSLLWELVETGCVKTYSPASLFSGNLIESKITGAPQKGALLAYPITRDNNTLALAVYHSNSETAFSTADILLGAVMRDFAEYIADTRIYSAQIA